MTGPELEIRLLALYPDQMNIYADRGNMIFLRRRCEWRGIAFRLESVAHGEDFDPTGHDLIYIGGGQDRDQLEIAGDMRQTKRSALVSAAEQGVVVLAVCGGYQLLGNAYTLDGERIEGIGILDAETIRESGPRLIGNIAIDTRIPGSDGQLLTLAGFENHGGRTYLGSDTKPLGSVVSGHGNNGRDGFEGAVSGPTDNVIGTYLHGPLLPKNYLLADHLIEMAIRHRYKSMPDFDLGSDPSGSDALERDAHESALQATR